LCPSKFPACLKTFENKNSISSIIHVNKITEENLKLNHVLSDYEYSHNTWPGVVTGAYNPSTLAWAV
jgi:hypothetical protein